MRCFRQFLYEVVRSPQRADKLGNYLTHRHENSGKVSGPYILGRKIALDGAASDREANSLMNALHKHISARKLKSDKQLFDQHSKLQTLPIGSLRAGQSYVNHSSEQFHGYKLGDKRPIYVVKHKGQHIIYDGHHRWIRDRLLGQKHIAAYVYDADEKLPPKVNKSK